MASSQNSAKNTAPGKGLTPWKKGQSGNPGGRPKALVSVVELARSHTTKAIATLALCLDDEKGSVRVAAATAILDRGWGKPAQAITGPDGGPVKADLGIEDVLRKLVSE